MANPRYLWVRDVLSFDTPDVAAPSRLSIDLLWKARTGQNIQGSNVAAQLQPLPAGEPRAVYDRPLAPQDISGALVKRIFISSIVSLAPLPVIAAGQVNLSRWSSAGFYEGIRVANSAVVGYGTGGSYPGDAAASVAEDWMHWRRVFMLERNLNTQFLSESPNIPGFTGHVAMNSVIDCKSQRRLREWDDTVQYEVEPSSGETMDNFTAAWSVLLETPS